MFGGVSFEWQFWVAMEAVVSIVVWVWVFGYRVVDLGFGGCGLGFR